MDSLYNKLTKYAKSDYYPFHMPGHKRNVDDFPNPYGIDITEIDGFDNLHHPEGIIKNAMEKAAEVFGASHSYFLVNGSTGGLLSAIFASAKNGEEILIARNSHKSVYNGVFLRELQITYSYPHKLPFLALNCGISSSNIDYLLITNPQIRAILITSPTYEGIVSNIKEIAAIVHKHGKILIVDEAHGAHFGFNSYFPESAIKLGADLVIQSLHKTLPALTQTAILHLNGELVNKAEVENYLSMFQTSSPSYVLMASMNKCIENLELFKEEMFLSYVKELDLLRCNIDRLKFISILNKDVVGKYDIYDLDRSKLVIFDKTEVYTGKELYDILITRYHLQMEMSVGKYLIAMTSINDTKEGFMRLYHALKEIDDAIGDLLIQNRTQFEKENRNRVEYNSSNIDSAIYLTEDKANELCIKNEIKFSVSKAKEMPLKKVLIEESIGKISGEYLYLYPPGIPLIIPGEVIEKDLICYIKNCKKDGYSIQGLEDVTAHYIHILHVV